MSAKALPRESLPEEDHSGGAGAHPYARKPLTTFQSITAICDDCGHTAVLDRDRLVVMTSVSTFADLWRHAYCAECRAVGSPRRRITLHGLLLETSRPLESHWSDKRVFGDDRSDLNPGLPRRRIGR